MCGPLYLKGIQCNFGLHVFFFFLCLFFSYDSWSSIGKEKVPTYKIYVCIAYCLWGSFIHVQGGEICPNVILRQNPLGN